jgi:hypothetical protein
MALTALVTLLPQAHADSGTETGPLLKTSWKQRGAYAAFTPDHQRLGCWSVALAQILFYHGLTPQGSTQYSGKGYSVSADFDNPVIDLGKVVETLPETEQGSETARYLYYVALVTGKDFGTGGYTGNSDVRRQRLEKHFAVKTSRVRYPKNSQQEVEAFVRGEVSGKRPLLLYVEGKEPGEEGVGHALVIDGFRNAGSFQVHLNFGWAGVSDGWYEIWEPIKSKHGDFNRPERWIMAVRPKQ